ncbi:TonB-dependent receptor [Caulobacter sp. B11]|uniref:TonB-dependent receptor n=1 Tax=Caulobacter sp. B11 TaxID=2048899 RepID=UPI000C12C7DC|nr:TonB-dependent receptor [Caulobacter sp. B11]PHY12813.1 TonB-dependent receptor [Caulobacter sp. B11]
MRSIHTTLLMSAVSALALNAASNAWADAVPAPADAVQVEQLIVTAQKREQKVIDVPVALTAYSGAMLETLGIQEFEELSLFVPGFEVQNQSPNNPGFVMRGITSDSGEATNEPRVSVYQDGVSISKSRGSYVELFDLERIEVAKGPQSTLYGRGALIGAVNVIQAKARPGFSSAAKIEAGNFGYWLAEGMVNAPVTDTLSVRLAGRVKHRDGYVENLLGGEDFNSTDTAAVRLAVNWRPNDRLNTDLLINYQNDAPSGTSFKSLTYLPTHPDTGAVLGDRGRNSGAALATVAGFENNQKLGLERDVFSATALASYKISDSLSLASTSAYRRFAGEEVFDADGFSLPLFTFAEDAQGKSVSQDVRLNYDAGGKITAFGGLSYFWEDGSQRVPLLFNERAYAARASAIPGFVAPNVAGLNVINSIPGFAPLKSQHLESYTNYGTTKSYDAYADVTWKATDQLELAAGVRYTYDDKESGYAAQLLNGGSVLGGSTPTVARGLFVQPTKGGLPEYRSLNDSGVTYRVVGRYAVTPDANLYASVATGRRPKVVGGGTPATPGGAVRFSEIPAEEVTSYEAGAKGAFFERRLTLDGAVYRYDYQNFQTSIRTSGGQIISTNAGEASATGFEGQATVQINANASVFGTYAYSHARFGNGLFKDNSFRLSPDNSLSFGANVGFDSPVGRFTVTPTYTWQSEVFFDNNNDRADLQTTGDKLQDEKQGAYGLMNLRVGYQPDNTALKFELFATNLLEQDYIKDAGNTGDAFGIPTFIAGEPRFVGVSMSIKR